jgi:plasmid stabilization system protein ParE
MAEVIWSDDAFEHLAAINRFIGRRSPMSADRTVTRIVGATRRFEKFPASGRVVPELGSQDIREVIVDSYRVLYQYEGSDVLILAVRHAAQRLTALTDL